MTPQISPILFDILSKNPILIQGDYKERTERILNFNSLKENILTLGDWEHTGDWDPYILVTLNDDTKIESQNGYHHIMLQGTKILLEDEYDFGQQKDEDLSYHVILIEDIKSITLLR